MPPLSIGVTRPSGQPLARSGARTYPSAYGAGVGQALQQAANAGMGFAGSLQDVSDAEENLSLAHRHLTEQTDRFNTLTAMSRWEEGLKQEIAEASQQISPSAEGYTNTIKALVDNRRQEFMANVPPALQEEFNYRSSATADPLVTQAYGFEVNQRQNYFRQTLAEDLERARSEVYNNPSSFNDQTVQFLEKINATTLNAAEKEDIALKARRSFEMAAAGKEAEEAALSVGTIGPADGKDVVAAGLPAIGRGMLNAIAAVESPDYNVMYGGEKFASYADHPRQSHVITSGPNKGGRTTAAGRYQFLASTWDSVAREINAPDFSPEWQDRAAWHLAQRDYKERTGRDLYEDVMSGDRDRIKLTKAHLEKTWEGLSSMSADEWANRVLGGRGAGQGDTGPMPARAPDVFNDPRFANLTLEQKLAVIEDGERRADKRKADQMAAEKELYDDNLQEFYTQIQLGGVGRAAIEERLVGGGFQTFAQYEKAVDIYDGRVKENEDLFNGTVRLASGGTWDPGSADHKRELSAVAANAGGLEMLDRLDQGYVTDRLVPLVSQTQAIPDNVLGLLEGMVRTSDPQRMAYAYETMRQLEQVSPDAFRHQVPDKVEDDYHMWMGLRDTYSLEETVSRMKGAREFRQLYPALVEEADKYLRDEVQMDKVAAAVGGRPLGSPDQPITTYARAQFSREFQALFRDAYTKSADLETAEQVAIAQMQKTWSSSRHGGGWALMKFAPERSGYLPIGDSHEWIDTQLQTEYPELAEASRYQLVADAQTQAERSDHMRKPDDPKYRANLPSYNLFKEVDGVISAVMDDTNQPVRWRGDRAAAQERAITEVVTRSTRLRYLDLQEKGAGRTEEEEVEFNSLVDQLTTPVPVPRPSPPPEDRSERLRENYEAFGRPGALRPSAAARNAARVGAPDAE